MTFFRLKKTKKIEKNILLTKKIVLLQNNKTLV